MCRWSHEEALKILAGTLGLAVVREEREIQAVAIRVGPGRRRLRRAEKGKCVNLKQVCCDVKGRWPLEGATLDELARFLEMRYSKPVLSLTSLPGRWSILLSPEAGKTEPAPAKKT